MGLNCTFTVLWQKTVYYPGPPLFCHSPPPPPQRENMYICRSSWLWKSALPQSDNIQYITGSYTATCKPGCLRVIIYSISVVRGWLRRSVFTCTCTRICGSEYRMVSQRGGFTVGVLACLRHFVGSAGALCCRCTNDAEKPWCALIRACSLKWSNSVSQIVTILAYTVVPLLH